MEMKKNLSKEELAKSIFLDNNVDLEKRVEDLLGRLTLEEKFTLSSGTHMWKTKPIKRLGIHSFKMTDGPHGLGALGSWFKKVTYFPVAICRAATWNPELSEQLGIAIAQEVRSINYHMLLGPGINIHRTPLCGRTFEYQTEDPYLNKKLAVSVVKGIQSQRIAACVKHYACNNQEHKRFSVSAEINERTLREIFLPAFEAVVREADVWSFMTAYNKVNGIYCCENKNLIKERLIEEWGFRGFVVTDWFGSRKATSTENCVNAGLTLDMPRGIVYNMEKMKRAYKEGKIAEKTINENVRRLLRVMFLVGLFDDKNKIPPGSRNSIEHQAIARKIAEEGIILLKNNENLLPLDIEKVKTVAVLGPNANKKMALGGGSSMVRPFYEVTPLKGLKEICKDKIKILKTPAEADIAIIFAGLNHKKHNDRENIDRIVLELPEDQIRLINNTVRENPKTIVVLINGSPITMNGWLDKVPAVVEVFYAGMEAGRVIADILFGKVNPSGKLPITFPKKLSDSPAHASIRTYPGVDKVYYEEGIFVGYRYCDTKNVEPLFPFGYGLSYTNFSFKNLKISNNKVSGDEKFTVKVDITNTGKLSGAEVVQLYVQDVEVSMERPFKELKGFKKIKLEPAEQKTLEFELGKKDFSFYDEKIKSWTAKKGAYNILIGSSSRDIRLRSKVQYLG